MATKLYLRNFAYAGPGTLPSAEQGAGTADVTWTGATTLLGMSTTLGAGQTSKTGTNATTSAQRHFIGMWASPPLAAQTIAQQAWTFGVGHQEANAAANFSASLQFIYVWRPSTGAKVGDIRDDSNAAANLAAEAGTSETVSAWFASLSPPGGLAVQEGDVIIFEVWSTVTASMSGPFTLTVYYDGTSDLDGVADGTATSNAGAFIRASTGFTLLDTNGKWSAQYPSRHDRRTLGAAGHPFHFWPDRELAAVPAPDSSWQPEYPDIVRGPVGLRAANQLVYVDPDILPEPYLYTWWKPSYPDRIPAAQRLVTGAQLAYSGPQRQPDPPAYAWDGDFLDRVWPRRGLAVSDQAAYFAPTFVDTPAVVDRKWASFYPDRIDPPRGMGARHQQTFAAPVRQPDPPARSWSAVYVDSTRGPMRLVTSAQSALHAPTRQPEPPPSWRGTWPDKIDPKRGLPAPLQQSHAAPTRQPEPPPLAWEARYPSKIDPRRGLWSAQQRAYMAPERQPDPPARAWCGVFPDRVPGVWRLVTSAQMAHTMPGRQPEPVFFRGGYPDRIVRHRIIVALQPSWAAPSPFPLPPPPDLWCVTYPDFTRRRVGLIVASQRAHFFPEIKADAWTPAPPDTDPTWTPDAIDGAQVWTADAVDTSQTWTPDDVDDTQIWTPDTVDPSQDWTPDDS